MGSSSSSSTSNPAASIDSNLPIVLPDGWEDLRGSLSAGAAAFARGEPGFEAARINKERTWNLDILVGRYPAIIVQPATPQDVSVALRFAVPRAYEICVACGRHSPFFLKDGCFLIDLFKMDKVELDPERRLAVVQGGALLGAVDNACAPHGLGATFGHVHHTGVGGLVQHGGHGNLERMLGQSVDSLLSVDVVLADGRCVTASPQSEEHGDLFWGVCGGSGNLGVVVSFTFQLHVLPNRGVFWGGQRMYRPSLAPLFGPSRAAVVQHWNTVASRAPNELSGGLVLECGGPVTEISFWAGQNQEQGRKYIASHVANFSWAVKSDFRPRSYHSDLQRAAKMPQGWYYNKDVLLEELHPVAMRALADMTSSGYPNARCVVIVSLLGGKGAERPLAETAVGRRKLLHWVVITARWDGTAPDAAAQRAKCVAWARELQRRCSLGRGALGTHGAFASDDAPAGDAAAARGAGAEGAAHGKVFGATDDVAAQEGAEAASAGASSGAAVTCSSSGDAAAGAAANVAGVGASKSVAANGAHAFPDDGQPPDAADVDAREGAATHGPVGEGAANYARLRQVKKKYDARNVFRCNSNVPPAQ